VLAFFLTMALGLGESVGIQSMTVTIQSLRAVPPNWRWYISALSREFLTAVLLGCACGATVALIVTVWRGEGRAAVAIGLGILTSQLGACVFGLSVPAL